MKILIVSQYFWPESFRINDLVVALKERGHEVTILTGKPNYPQGKIYKGYRFWGYKKERYEGMQVIRVPLIPRGNSSGLRLAINYLSFVIFSSAYLLFWKRHFDVSITFAVSPITAVFPAILHKKLYKSKVCLWVQDLWPESISAAGKIRSGFLMRVLNKMVRFIYKSSDRILVQSEAFRGSILEKGVDTSKIKYVPNWAEDLFIDTEVNADKYKNLVPPGFIVMFAGNMGESQDFDSILKAATLTRNNTEIKWLIIGDGRKRKFVDSEVKRLGLEETFFTLGRFPVEEMPHLFVHADIMLISLKDEYIFSLTIPSKIQSYMAFGKPVLTMVNGIGSSIIQEADCGYISYAGDYVTLANNAIAACACTKELLVMKGENGRRYYLQNFSKEKIIDNLLDICKEL